MLITHGPTVWRKIRKPILAALVKIRDDRLLEQRRQVEEEAALRTRAEQERQLVLLRQRELRDRLASARATMSNMVGQGSVAHGSIKPQPGYYLPSTQPGSTSRGAGSSFPYLSGNGLLPGSAGQQHQQPQQQSLQRLVSLHIRATGDVL